MILPRLYPGATASSRRPLVRASTLILATALAVGVPACSKPPELVTKGERYPIAVDSEMIIYVAYERCAHETMLPDNPCEGKLVKSIQTATADDPSVLEVVGPVAAPQIGLGAVKVRARAPGQSGLRVTFLDEADEEQTVDMTISAEQADRVELTTQCLGDRQNDGLRLPTSHEQGFELRLFAGSTLLAARSYAPLDFGSLTLAQASDAVSYTPVDHISQQLTLLTPSASATTTLTSAIDQGFSLTVEVFEQTSIDGIVLLPLREGPYKLSPQTSAPVDIDVAVTVAGKPACSEGLDGFTKEVAVATPEICALQSAAATVTSRLTVRPRKAGLCRVTATLPNTPHEASLELTFESGE